MRVAIILVTVLGATTAWSQPSEESPADTAFREGRAALDHGDAAKACERFTESFKLSPDSPPTMLNLGLCHEALGHTATALRWFRRAQVRGAEIGNVDFEDAAKRKTLALSERVPTIRVEVVGAPRGAVVTINGAPTTELELSRIEVDPGTFKFELTGARHPISETVVVKDGDKRTVVLRVVVPVPPPPKLVSVDPVVRRRRAYLLGGAGLTAYVGVVTLGLIGRSITGKTEQKSVDDRWESIVDYGGGGLFVAGTAAIAGAVYLYVTTPRRERVVAPVVGPRQLGVAVGGTF